jgi:hypothetical protein
MSGSGTPGAARNRLLIRALILVAGLAIALPFLSGSGRLGLLVPPACGCASMPTAYNGGPSPTPWPVSADQAAEVGRQFTGTQMIATAWSPEAAGLYELRAVQSYAFVDGVTGRMLEVFLLDRMPTSDPVTVAAEDARAAASAYLERAGASTAGMSSSVRRADRSSVAYFDVVWKDASGSPGPEVLVNPTTGAVFGFADVDFAHKHGLGLPVVGQAVATLLAQGSSYAAGEPAMSTDFEVMAGLAGEPAFGWTVVFNDGVLNVDAVTGEVAILKWSALR